jgi:DNA repair protein RadA
MAYFYPSLFEVANNKHISIFEAQRFIDTHRVEIALELRKPNSTKGVLINTGSTRLDSLLSGGVSQIGLTEFYGASGCGKTQLVHQLCVNAAKSSLRTLFVDCEGTFSPSRIRQISGASKLNPEDIMRSVLLFRAFSAEDQVGINHRLPKLVLEHGIKVVVIDTVAGLFNAYLSSDLSVRMYKLKTYIYKLAELALNHNLIVVVTNQVRQIFISTLSSEPQELGGLTTAYLFNTRIMLKALGNGTFSARVMDSSFLNEDETIFKISASGVGDC